MVMGETGFGECSTTTVATEPGTGMTEHSDGQKNPDKRLNGMIKQAVILAAAVIACCVFRALPYASARELFQTDSFTVHQKPDGDIRTRFLSESFLLGKGVYTIQYDGTVPTETELVVGTARRLEAEDGADVQDGVQCIPLRVPGGTAHREWRVYAERGVEAALLVREYYEGNGVPPAQMHVSVVYRPMLSAGCCVADTLLFFAALFLLVLVLRHAVLHRERADAYTPLLLYALVVFVSFPLFRHYITYGHDTIFHVRRIASLAEELFAGRIPVRLAQTWKNGYGYPVSIFYGDVLMVPAAVLFRLGMPLFRAYQFYAIVMNAVTVLLSYHCFRLLSGKPWAALFLSAMYAGSVRYAANLYLRGAIGEDSALAVMPLAVLGFYALMEKKNSVRPVLYLTLGFTALIQTHTLSTIQATVFAFLFCLVHFRTLLREGRLRILLIAAGLTALLNAWFILPFVDYYTKHSFYTKAAEPVAETAVKLSQMFAPEDRFTAIGSGTLLLLIFCAAAIPVFASGRLRKDKDGRSFPKAAVTVLGLSVLAVWMGTEAFPWTFLEARLSVLYNLLGGHMQYVWRYFSIATLLICATAALVMREAVSDTKTKRAAGLAVAVLLVCVSLYGTHTVQSESLHPETEKPVLRAADVWNGDGGDALYMFDDLYWFDVPQETILADEGVTFANVSRDGTAFTADVENMTDEACRIAFPVWNYYGYRAEGISGDAQKTALSVKDGEGHRVSVQIPAGFQGSVRVAFREPWYWRAAEAVSILTGIAIAVFVLKSRERSTG